jgi:hypothetical protein
VADDPSHGTIDADIRAYVQAMEPSSLGQRVAIEQTLQNRRDRGDTLELSLEPTEHEGPRSGGAAATASPDPLTPAEYDAIVGTIWNELDGDPHRFDDLLADALGFIAGIALHEDTDPHEADRATAALRSFEQRALWGPDHEQEDHR